MSRIVFRLALVWSAFSLSCLLHATDKDSSAHPIAEEAKRQVQAALRAEAAGDNDRCTEHLRAAESTSPNSPEANWHLARVALHGEWFTLDNAQQESARDAQLAEYRKLRDEAEGNLKLTRNLARWCVKTQLDDLARVHYAQLLSRGDVDAATREEAIRRLDLHNVGGSWMTTNELKQRQDRSEAVAAAIRQWQLPLKRLQLAIDGLDDNACKQATKELAAIDDPHIILVLQSLLVSAGDRFSEQAAKVFARFPHAESTEALARVAVMSPYVLARTAAIAELRNRQKQDYMPLLLSALVAPVRMQFSISVKNGILQYSQAIGMEGPGARYISLQSQSAMPATVNPRTGYPTPTGPSRPAAAMVEVASAASYAQTVGAEVQLTNAQIAQANQHTFEVLEQVSGVALPRDATQYWNWWQDYNQYYWPKPTYCAYQQRPATYYFAGTLGNSCFVVGTLVRTQLGLSPIECIKPGDRVLSQDPDSGELTYKPVLRTTLRPPRRMVSIRAGGDEITATLGHPFWVAGQGWKMAKELQDGDLLHSLEGAVRIEMVEQAGEDKAYNLVVDEFNTYFVGQQGLLVHDNEFRKPTRAIVPGLLEEQVAVVGAARR